MSDWTFSKNKPKQSQFVTTEDSSQKTEDRRKMQNKPNLGAKMMFSILKMRIYDKLYAIPG